MPHELNGQLITSATNSTPNEPNGQVSDSMISSSLHEFIPIEINRFNGKNHQFWALLTEELLEQLKIAYVIFDPCPSFAIRPETIAEEIAQATGSPQHLDCSI